VTVRYECPGCGRLIASTGPIYSTPEKKYVYLRMHRTPGGETCLISSVTIATKPASASAPATRGAAAPAAQSIRNVRHLLFSSAEIVVDRAGERRFVRCGPLWVVVAQTRRGHPTGAEWGTWDDQDEATAFAVDLYRRALLGTWAELDGALYRRSYLDGLAGRDLACWCPLDQPCHADVPLQLANR
jgi:hypothetical protein